MLEGLGERVRHARRRVRRVERRELRQFRRWLETTSNLTRVSVLVFVPLLIALVTVLSNAVDAVSFLLFPPLASGTYTLFADPEGKYSSPVRFVGGLTVGALCGWAALELSAHYLYSVEPGSVEVHAGAAAIGVVLTGVVTWALDVELPTAYSTALLVLITGPGPSATLTDAAFAYVLGVFLSSSLIAAVFVAWREEFYDERARYLYGTTTADDHVLVPMRGETALPTAMFGARLAAAHEAGKVVLLDIVDDEELAARERALLDERGVDDAEVAEEAAEAEAATEAANALETHADRIETDVGVPVEVVVVAAGTDTAKTALRAADEANCDLVVTPYEEERGHLSSFVQGLFRSNVDVVAFRSATGRTTWRRMMVPVGRASGAAHAMIDYAARLAGRPGSVSVCHCIDREADRRRAESMLADLVETTQVRTETRVSRSSVAAFLRRNASAYDVVFLGASTDRSTASRVLSPPTFRNVADLETDAAVVHRG